MKIDKINSKSLRFAALRNGKSGIQRRLYMKICSFLSVAGVLLVMALTFSCSSPDDDGGGGTRLSVSSSSSAESSSSSVAPSSSSYGGLCAGFDGAKRLHYGIEKEQFCDERDGKEYVYVVIGTQTWMAENLNYAVDGSKCYSNSESNCNTYGRLYDWSTAMALQSSCNSNSCSSLIKFPYRGICPVGWHIPSNAEWYVLVNYVGSSTVGKYLKATSGWNSCGPSGSGSSYLCEDTYGFSALPGGNGGSGGSFYDVGDVGNWWSVSEDNSYNASRRGMYYYNDYTRWYINIKFYLFSVRCVQD